MPIWLQTHLFLLLLPPRPQKEPDQAHDSREPDYTHADTDTNACSAAKATPTPATSTAISAR